ncbi:Glycosyl transferase, family 25 [Sulfitobacter noctilucae]|uniref:glycosyltransferase family 25 protein n=1 Tax=Sulfitobacter noctilucae TaxID=1342302 RepID=UPI000467EF5D|nr:glycosyltransferase family 25 protein [Sulfitobacter noctilucae]KIN75249.1 Glycosyl transferase, family 25 [Sulfitobacter noctilucae]
MRSLIIHLSRATERADNVSRLLRELPDAVVVEAVDGSDPAQIAGVAPEPGTLYHPTYPFGLNQAEVACFLSHRRCWQMIAEGDAPLGLIVEDDMDIDPAPFAAALDLAQRHADEESFVRFPAKERERPTKAIARQNGTSLFLPKIIGLQAVCQLVGRRAARRLLTVTEVIDRPVDTLLQMHWVTEQPVHAIWPSGISELGAASTIQRKTRTSDVLMREVRRANYRAKVKRRPQLA